jgi:ACS family tartrate transporter-like MFS transporter
MTINGSGSSTGLGDRLLAFFWRKPATTLAERTRRRVSLHLVPFLFFLYILAYLDRVNVSVAELAMEEGPEVGGLGFSREVVGFGAGLFFLGYWILEIPSTVSVVRWGARWVFVRILVLWGICAALVGTIGTPFGSSLFSWLPHVSEQGRFLEAVDGFFGRPVLASVANYVNELPHSPKNQFYFFRFMLGFFEGGFFPSVIVYLSLWFRAADRAKAIAGFMSAIPLSSMLGLPFSGLLLKVNWFGLPGWRWVFILEGVAPILAGFATVFLLPDRPAKAKWLPAEERAWLETELDREHKGKQGHGHWAWVHHLGMVLLLTLTYFCLNLSSYGLSMFMPAIIKSQTGSSNVTASLLASLPYLMGFIAILINGWHSDRSGERIWHVAIPLSLSSAGILLAALTDRTGLLPVFLMIFWVGTFMYAHLPAFWPIPSMFLGATAAASAIGFINMIGNLGGFVGPNLVGKAAEGQASFAGALMRLAPWPLASALIILAVGYFRRQHPIKAEETPLPEAPVTAVVPAEAVTGITPSGTSLTSFDSSPPRD